MSDTTSTNPVLSEIHPITASRYVTVKLYSRLSGKSEGAIRKKIERGIWLEGRQYRRDREGCIWINTLGVERWVEGTE